MRILLTGISWFVASHLTDAILSRTDHEIVSLDRLDTSGNLNRLPDLPSWKEHGHRVKFVWHDLRSEINDIVANKIGDIDIILHLAAGSHVDRSIDDPMEFAMDNVIGTVNLLQYARKLKNLKLFNYFSTDEVYGDAPEWVDFAEWSPHKPRNPYSASKAAAEDFCYAFRNTYKLPIFITNTMNIFGERQHGEKFIPLVIKKVLTWEKVTIHSHPDLKKAGTRFYLHAGNLADAILWLLDNAKVGEQYNLVGEKELDNLTLAQMIADIIGKPLNYEMVDFHSSRPGHDLRYALDGSKLKSLGYEFPANFEESLRRTVKWFQDNPEWLLK